MFQVEMYWLPCLWIDSRRGLHVFTGKLKRGEAMQLKETLIEYAFEITDHFLQQWLMGLNTILNQM